MAELNTQWYTDPHAACPFALTRKITFKRLSGTALQNVAPFPWTRGSVGVLWEGCQKVSFDSWNNMITEHEDAVATATNTSVEICFTRKNRFVNFRLPPVLERTRSLPSDAVHLAWVLSPSNPCQPLLVVSRLHTVFILNVVKFGSCACLVGHGGAITSIAVHPVHPHIFATTSRDYTARIYDLRFPPRTEEDVRYNPSWAPITDHPSQAGPAYGLIMGAKEGDGIGRCVIVLTGGLIAQSGGHAAAVLGAAFHANKPLIATCGLDRAVKIWALPPALDSSRLIRVEKPIFSSISIHRARVLSINWLAEDVLLSHDAPAILRTNRDKPFKHISEPGEIIVWQWLGLERFFPADLTTHQQVLRPVSSDWMDSSSFRVLCSRGIPHPKGIAELITPLLHLCTLRPRHSMPANLILLTFPTNTWTRLIHMTQALKGGDTPTFPFDQEPTVISEGKAGDQTLSQSDGKDVITGWLINIEDNSVPKLNTCAMTTQGDIVGVGTEGTLWTWTIR